MGDRTDRRDPGGKERFRAASPSTDAPLTGASKRHSFLCRSRAACSEALKAALRVVVADEHHLEGHGALQTRMALQMACTHTDARALRPPITDRPHELLTPLPRSRLDHGWPPGGRYRKMRRVFIERLNSIRSFVRWCGWSLEGWILSAHLREQVAVERHRPSRRAFRRPPSRTCPQGKNTPAPPW